MGRAYAWRVVSGPAENGRLRVGVVGAGSWGTTAAMVCAGVADAPAPSLWARSVDVVQEINTRHTNSKYLAGAVLPASIHATADIAELVAASDLIVMAVPSQGFRGILEMVAAAGASTPKFASKPVVSLAKGLGKCNPRKNE